MSELTLTVIRLGFLALLWAFVLITVQVMRSDLFPSRVNQRSRADRRRAAKARTSSGSPSPAAAAAVAASAKPAKPAKPRRGSPRTLVVTQGSLVGTTVTLGETPVTIGRANESTVVLTDDYTSGRHARLYPQDGRWVIEDLGSTNGTYLDKQKVTSPTPVPVGVPIRVGKTVLELRK